MAEADVQWIDLVRSKIFAVWDLDDAELLRLGRATCAMQASDPIEFANIYANGGVEEHTADLLVEIAKQGNRPPLK